MKAVVNRNRYLLIIPGALIVIALIFISAQSLIDIVPGGEDLIAHWRATDLLFTENISPYSENSQEQVNAFLESTDSDHQILTNPFSSPLFVTLIYAPLTLTKNEDTVRAVWITLSVLFLIFTGYFLQKTTNFKLGLFFTTLCAFFLVFSLPSYVSIMSGNLSSLSLLFISGSFFAISREKDETAGILLALSFINPKLVCLTAIFILIWSFRNDRKQVAIWFLGCLLLLIGFSMVILPDWPIQYIRNYFIFNIGEDQLTNQTILERLTWVKNIGIILLVGFEWLIARRNNTDRFFWLVGLTLILSQLLSPSASIGQGVVILPGIFYVFSIAWKRWNLGAKPILIILIGLLFSIPWLISGVLQNGFAILGINKWAVIFSEIISVIILYWSRWWVPQSSGEVRGKELPLIY